MDKVKELENAILARAERLAEQYRRQARSGRENVLRDASEKLRLREEREVLVAKALAERAYRRHVQAQEIKLQARLDQLRWNLVTGTREGLMDQVRLLLEDEPRYLDILRQLLQQSVHQLPAHELIVEVNEIDRARLSGSWEDFIAGIDKQVMLGEHTLDCVGGLLIRSLDNRMRVDNTFEGRLHRLERRIYETVQEHLVPPSVEQASVNMSAG